MRKTASAFLFCFLLAGLSHAQDKSRHWQRRMEATRPDLHLFHSTRVINLPTAETHQQGDFEFEVSHRFIPPFSDGFQELYGLDGPVTMRISLGYALTDDLLLTLGRSNLDDNVDLWAKYRLIKIDYNNFPVLVALRAGAAWNTINTVAVNRDGFLVERDKDHERNFQQYLQLIVNFMPDQAFAFGAVPSVIFNRDIRTPERKDAFVLGTYAQYYFLRLWSVQVEWTTDFDETNKYLSSFAAGLELETGGHFFKLFATNQTSINPAQYLGGAADSFEKIVNWRLGFLITRLL
jgi:hypothetical protein